MSSRTEHFIILLLAVIMAASGCIQGTPSSTSAFSRTTHTSTSYALPSYSSSSPCSGILWRYLLRDAIPCMLSDEELARIEPLSASLKGKSVEESIWNILMWEDEHITYDWEKAKLPLPRLIVYSNGTVRILQGANNTIQTPYETVRKGKGICTDYSILTAALLLAMNYSPVYIFEINMTDSGHAAAAYRIRGWFFILDQHLPPMDLGAYYRYWNGTIKNATIYEILRENGTAVVKTAGVLRGSDFLIQSYSPGENDLRNIWNGIAGLIAEHFKNLALDSSLASMEEGELPSGYRDGRIWTYEFPGFADYYNPVFHKQFVRYFYRKIEGDLEVRKDLASYSAFWLDAKNERGTLKLTLFLARKG